jgi:S-(hydroxymethyl)glutathione dehydrogenase/alcohol dehydrogenase
MIQAAVLNATGDTAVRVRDDVTTVGPGAHEVKVRIRAAGICHSDLSAMNGTLPQPVPAVLGHEASGEVIEVGDGVTDLAVGDRVIVAWIPPCGACRNCLRGQPYLCTIHVKQAYVRPRFVIGGSPGFGMAGCGTWAEEVVLPRAGAVRIDPDVPFEIAALIGCGVMTGVGAVINTAKVEPGASVVVFGCGGVGISAIQGARLAGASVIVGVDPVPVKHELAERFGATAATTPEGLAALAAELGLGKGFDYAFEVVGRPETIRAAWASTRRGGTTVIVGAGSTERTVTFSPSELLFDGKQLLSSLYGSADVRRDYDRVLGLWRAGRLDLAGMISARLSLADVNDGIQALHGAEVVRQLVIFDKE